MRTARARRKHAAQCKRHKAKRIVAITFFCILICGIVYFSAVHGEEHHERTTTAFGFIAIGYRGLFKFAEILCDVVGDRLFPDTFLRGGE